MGVAPSAIREPLRQLRVLVAEDHTTNQAIAVRILEKLGHVAVGVGDGEEAIAELRRMPYDASAHGLPDAGDGRL